MDFVADQLFDGREFRALPVVDNFSRFCHAIRVGKSIKGIDVVEVLERLKRENSTVPKRIQVDTGSEFISKDVNRWAYENKVVLDYSRPGKPTDNPFIESFMYVPDECYPLIPGQAFPPVPDHAYPGSMRAITSR